MFETLLQFDESDDGTELIAETDTYYHDTTPCPPMFEVEESFTMPGIGGLN
jgi:hypothetical protein